MSSFTIHCSCALTFDLVFFLPLSYLFPAKSQFIRLTFAVTLPQQFDRGRIFSESTDQPQVTLQLGSTLNPDDIKEGDDVYFECHIKANPKENRITWWHDVSTQLYIIIYKHFE